MESIDGNDKLCDELFELVREGDLGAPKDGYRCGSAHYKPETDSASNPGPSSSRFMAYAATTMYLCASGLVFY